MRYGPVPYRFAYSELLPQPSGILSLLFPEGGSQGAAVPGQPLEDFPAAAFSGRLRLVIIDVGARGDGAGDNSGRTFFLQQFAVSEGELLLENHSILIWRIGISAKAEISQTVYNVSAPVFLNSLQDMGVVAQHEICSPLHRVVRQGLLRVVRAAGIFNPRMDAHDN